VLGSSLLENKLNLLDPIVHFLEKYGVLVAHTHRMISRGSPHTLHDIKGSTEICLRVLNVGSSSNKINKGVVAGVLTLVLVYSERSQVNRSAEANAVQDSNQPLTEV